MGESYDRHIYTLSDLDGMCNRGKDEVLELIFIILPDCLGRRLLTVLDVR